MHTLVLVLELVGTFVFALSGGVAGVRHKLDLFGVVVLAFAASSTGGIVRDVLIGRVPPPPAAIADWRYLAVSATAGVITFYFHPAVDRLRGAVLMSDAIGLSVFAVAGAEKALATGMHPFVAAVMGMLTGIGGGIARDVLLAEVPTVLRADFYALAALAGAGVAVAGPSMHVPPTIAVTAGAVLCFGLRFMAIRHGWHLPTARARRREVRSAE